MPGSRRLPHLTSRQRSIASQKRCSIYLQPVMIAMKKSIPAKLPRKEVTHMLAISMMVQRRCRKAVIMNYLTSATAKFMTGGYYHDVTCEQVRATEHNHDESDRKKARSDGPNETGSVLLIPRGCLCSQCNCTAATAVSEMILQT